MPVQQAPAAKVRRKQSAGEEKATDFSITLRNILRSPASKEADTGRGRNGRHTRQSFACLQAGVTVFQYIEIDTRYTPTRVAAGQN